MKEVTITLDVHTAAAVRQALFDCQNGFTYDPVCVPSRIVNIRQVIRDLDTEIEKIVD